MRLKLIFELKKWW